LRSIIQLLLLLLFTTGTHAQMNDSIQNDTEYSQSSESETEINSNQYKDYFQPNSADATQTEKATFKKDLPQEYERLADQYIEKEPKPAEPNWFDKWLMKLLKIFPSINLAGLVAFLRILIYVLLGIAIILIVRYLMFKNTNWQIWKKPKPAVEQFEVGEESDLRNDYPALIQKALDQKDHRLVIRYYYLWLLSKLDAQEIIDFHPEKTNSDYLHEIKNQAHRKDFSYLSYLYDYIWYGEISMSDNDFSKIRKNFDSKLNEL